MSRLHYWQFLVSEEGVPIEDAEIYVYLAEGSSSADIFTSQNSASIINSVPSTHEDYDSTTLIKTDGDGYFDFWVEDEWGVVAPYETSQRFKIEWYKMGISEGYIDNISIFPTIIHPVDITDTDTTYDKLVSNSLAKGWTDDIDSLELSTSDHETRIDTLELSASDNKTSIDGKPNMYSSAAPSGSWTISGPDYYINVNHNLNNQYPLVQVWNTDFNTYEELGLDTTASDADNMIVFIPSGSYGNMHITIIG